MNDQLSNIIDDIRDGKCILILGPDIHDFDGQSFFERMCDELFSNTQYNSFFDNNPHYVFPNEELLQLKTGIKKRSVLKMMENFYKKQTCFDLPFGKIVQIPFQLIISLMPDNRLISIFERDDLKYSYGHYPIEEVPQDISEQNYPAPDKPLIYNLLGDFEKKEAIITFDDFFAFLSGIMGDRPLPKILQQQLKSADSFIFLGVHFERWHVQLLLKQMTLGGGINYSVLKNGNTKSKDVCLFVSRRLELDLLADDPLEFLDNLYQCCAEVNLLKKSPAKASAFISYSHKDKSKINQIISVLKNRRIEVIIDDNDMDGGENIGDFIKMIDLADSFLPVLSASSLKSPWVIKEIKICLDKNKHLVPLSLDEELFNFTAKDAQDVARENIAIINQKISEIGLGSSDDLDAEKKLWKEYNEDFSSILKALKDIKWRPVDIKNLDNCIARIADDIQRNLDKRP